MPAPALQYEKTLSAYGPYADPVTSDWELMADGPILEPPRRRRGRVLLVLAAIAVAGWGGWSMLGDGVDWAGLRQVLADFSHAVSERPEARSPLQVVEGAGADNATLSELPSLTVGEETAVAAVAPLIPLPIAVAAGNSGNAGVGPSGPTSAQQPANGDAPAPGGVNSSPPYRPPPGPTDALQARALAAGLHPGLSRALLSRLTENDFDNAAKAIQAALAKTPDTGVYVWPKARSSKRAQFEVRFVQGGAPTCRRYVVAVARDGWATTALPMEKCGVARQAGTRGASARR